MFLLMDIWQNCFFFSNAVTKSGFINPYLYNGNYFFKWFHNSAHYVTRVGRVAQSVSDWLRAGRSGDRIPVKARFFAHVQTGPGAHPAACTMGTGYFPGVKRPGLGADHPPPPSAEVENEWIYTSTPPVGPSWPVIGWPLPLPLQSHVTRLLQRCKWYFPSSAMWHRVTGHWSLISTHFDTTADQPLTCYWTVEK
jgi:hypothetical protein